MYIRAGPLLGALPGLGAPAHGVGEGGSALVSRDGLSKVTTQRHGMMGESMG